MRRIVTITAVLFSSMALYSCGDDCPGPEEPEASILFQVNPNSLMFGSEDKDAQSIFVAALNVTWKAEVEASAQDWLKITEESDRVSVRTEENTTGEPRSGKITITPDNQNLTPVFVTVTQALSETRRIPANMAIWAFIGDSRNSGFASYVITLGEGDGEFDEENQQIIITDGYALILELFGDDITRQDYQMIKPKTGTFDSSMDPLNAEFTFEKWSFLRTLEDSDVGYAFFDGSWMIHFSNGVYVDNIALTGGRVVMEGEPGNYHVLADVLTNRNERVVMEYTGPFNAISDRGSYSTYTGDHEISGLSTGQLKFLGEEWSSPGTFSWTASFETPVWYSGARFTAWFYSPQIDSTDLPTGSYVIQKDTPFTDFTATAGYLFGGYWESGAWVYEYDDAGKIVNNAPLIEGTISVVNNGGDNYTVTADALMDNYYTIQVSFEGDLEYMDKTIENVNAAGFKGIPYKMEDRGRPAADFPDRNDRSIRYGLKNID